ncbi:MAG: hypothetical protein H6Q89_3716 [Myxococcaceae bacterium]|nr:hypothetical protein [Myxococcaceae bacterium]
MLEASLALGLACSAPATFPFGRRVGSCARLKANSCSKVVRGGIPTLERRTCAISAESWVTTSNWLLARLSL